MDSLFWFCISTHVNFKINAILNPSLGFYSKTVELNLQFEWAWQHPTESLAVRSAAASFKSLSGIANKIKLAYTMLTLPSWQRYDLISNVTVYMVIL